MRSASLFLPPPDRQYDETDIQQEQEQEQEKDRDRDQDQDQELYWERQREQDVVVHASGDSVAAHDRLENIYEGSISSDDDDDDVDVDDKYNSNNNNNNNDYGGDLAAAAMTHALVHDDEDPEYLPDSLPLDDESSGLDYSDHHYYHHYHHYHHHHHLQGHDLDMSDTDGNGGVPLDSNANSSPPVFPSDLEYDPDDPFPLQEEEVNDDDDGDAGIDAPNGLGYYTLPPDYHLHMQMHYPIGSGLIMDMALPQHPGDLFPGHQQTPLPNAPPPPPGPQMADNALDPLPPVQLSNPNPSILGSENLGLVDFLRGWAYGQLFAPSLRLNRPDLHEVLKQARDGIEEVQYFDLRGDNCDLQGLDWDIMDTTREAARQRRRLTYKNYVNKLGSDHHPDRDIDDSIPSIRDFFRFKTMGIRRDVSLAHFQLRSVLACPSRTQAFYPSIQGINVMNTASRTTELAMNLREFPGMAAPAVSTLDAACGVLMGGTFNGDYCLQALDAEDKKSYSEGQISTDISGITNHIRIYRPRRSHSPVAAIASNDHGFRVMDLQTEKFISSIMYPFALNCSAVSPDGRLRAVVGDNLDVLITNADTGEILQKLRGHRDYGFACDWSDDGYTVATGFQDKGVKIWDARRWCNASGASTPLCTIRTEMAGVRSLRFSPAGSGKPVLVAAEEADFINIIDAQTFCSKQTIDVFGELGGVAFTDDGQGLNILCCDAHRGGLLQLERCGYGAEPVVEGWQRQRQQQQQRPAPYGWSSGCGDAQWHGLSASTLPSRRIIPPYLGGPEPF